MDAALVLRRHLLSGMLYFCLAYELVLTLAGFLWPSFALEVFGLPQTPHTLFLAQVLAWMFLLVTLLCMEAVILVRQHRVYGIRLSIVLGLWWTALGLTLFAVYGRWDNLVMDGVKGLLLLGAALGYDRRLQAHLAQKRAREQATS